MNPKHEITEKLVKEARKGSLSSPRSLLYYLLTIIYVISPIDLIPDTIPGFGQLDDAAVVILLISYIFKTIQANKKTGDK